MKSPYFENPFQLSKSLMEIFSNSKIIIVAFGGSAARPFGGPAARRSGSPVVRRCGGSAARPFGGSVVQTGRAGREHVRGSRVRAANPRTPLP